MILEGAHRVTSSKVSVRSHMFEAVKTPKGSSLAPQ